MSKCQCNFRFRAENMVNGHHSQGTDFEQCTSKCVDARSGVVTWDLVWKRGREGDGAGTTCFLHPLRERERFHHSSRSFRRRRRLRRRTRTRRRRHFYNTILNQQHLSQTHAIMSKMNVGGGGDGVVDRPHLEFKLQDPIISMALPTHKVSDPTEHSSLGSKLSKF